MPQKEEEIEKLNINILNEKDIVWLRWILLLIAGPIYLVINSRSLNPFLIVFFAMSLFFNFWNHIFLYKKKYPYIWFKLSIYIDVLLVSILIVLDSPYSYLYTLYYIIIIYEGFKRKCEYPIALSIFIILIYNSIVYHFSNEDFILQKLFFRDVFLLLSGVFVSQIQNELHYNQKQNKKNYDLAIKDKLTGLYNRNEFDKKLNEELYNCINKKECLCILLLDIDNFELFNDTYGRFTGDDLLKFFSKLIIESITKNDKAFRYGGEEFIVLLKNTQLEDAYRIGETIRKKLSSSNIYVKDGDAKHKITVSCGIANCPEHSVGYFELMEFADRALKEAKNDGKNKVVIAEK